MKVKELKEMLEDYDEEMEVTLMTQPNWPMECSISTVTSLSEIRAWADEDETPMSERGGDVVFIVEDCQIGYGTKKAFE